MYNEANVLRTLAHTHAYRPFLGRQYKKTPEYVMELNNVFAAIPGHLNEEIIDVLQQNGQVKIERIVSTGQISPETGWYDQAQHEWVIVLKGEAIIAFENKEIRLKVGDYINIPAHTRHRVSWTHPQIETVWLAVHY